MASTTRLKPAEIDALVQQAVFGATDADKTKARRQIMEAAYGQGIILASIQGLYEAAGKGLYKSKTVPAINIRGITYRVARAVFRAAMKRRVGAFIFEIARSEMGYTDQKPSEYVAAVLAAAIREGFRGFVFIQADHTQVSASKFKTEPDKELGAIKDLIRDAIAAGFFNIDIDASTIVDLSKPTLEEQQEKNCLVTAQMTEFIRQNEPKGVTVSVGGEIGEVGRRNSTVADLRAFMGGYRARLAKGVKGISKISVQTGTTHGGVVLPDGSIARVELDFDTLEQLSKLARDEYGMGGAVQHGASTLPESAFSLFPQRGTLEVHLATGFQNMIFDSAEFPKDLLQKVYAHLAVASAAERTDGESDEQFYYKTRKRAWGPFKKETWSLPEATWQPIADALEAQFGMLMEKLGVVDTVDLVQKYVPTASKFELPPAK